jgi:ribulose-phosphate 3-epimerase
MIKISPSLLSANVLRIEEEVDALVQANADLIHLDVMDQHYVPNLTFGPAFCKALSQRFPQLHLDVHLMVTPVHELIEAFAKAGAARIAIHPDACIHLDREIAFIKDLGCEVGLALNPATSLECLYYTRHCLDFVLVMTVNPGFGGQTLISSCIPKISAIKSEFPELSIAVDGGVNVETIHQLAQAGADTFIVGAGLFSSKNYAKTIGLLKEKATI